MKISAVLALSTFASTGAFSVSPKASGNVSVPKPVQQLGTAASTLIATLTIASSAATATPADLNMDFPTTSSTIVLSGVDPFAMPSYAEATKNKNIEVDLESINKEIMDKAAAARDSKEVNKENNQSYIDLRKAEKEEEARMQALRERAKQERLEAIAKEKAETKANRWNTF